MRSNSLVHKGPVWDAAEAVDSTSEAFVRGQSTSLELSPCFVTLAVPKPLWELRQQQVQLVNNIHKRRLQPLHQNALNRHIVAGIRIRKNGKFSPNLHAFVFSRIQESSIVFGKIGFLFFSKFEGSSGCWP